MAAIHTPSPRVVLVVLLILVQQAMLLEKGFSPSIGSVSLSGEPMAAMAPSAAAAASAEAAAVDNVLDGDLLEAAATETEGQAPTYGGNSTSDAILFVFCPSGSDSVRYVEQAVLSARTAGWSKRHIVLLDASYDGHCSAQSDFLLNETGYIYQTLPFDITFSMLQNVAWQLAKKWGFPFYFWQHADVIITSEGENQDFPTKALQAIREAKPNWGVILFAYDWFAGYKTEVVEAVRWDQGIPHYLGDCDFYARVRLAGYDIINDGYAGIVLHMKALLSEADVQSAKRDMQGNSIFWWKERGAFETRGVRMNREKYGSSKVDLLARKSKVRLDVRGVTDQSSNASSARYQEEETAGNAYFERKWGSQECAWQSNKMPVFDINQKVLKKKVASFRRAVKVQARAKDARDGDHSARISRAVQGDLDLMGG